MKLAHRLALLGALFVTSIGQFVQHGFHTAWMLFAVGSALITACNPQRHGLLQALTLTTSEITADVFAAFRKRLVALGFFATDFSGAQAKYGQALIAHVASLPSITNHDTTNGFFYSPSSARNLLTDVPVTMDVWQDVVLNLQTNDLVADRNVKYTQAINGAAYQLAKSMLDSVLAKVNGTNLSYSATCADASATAAKLRQFAATMNANGAGEQRAGIVSSGFMTGLLGDSIIASGDYYDQRQTSGPYAVLNNIAGFQSVMEYPDFGNIGTFTAATSDLCTMANSVKHGFAAGDVVRFTTTNTLPAGLAVNTSYYVIASGLTTTAFKVSATLGGSAVDITDTGTGTHTVQRYDLTGFFFENRAVVVASRLPADSVELAMQRGIPVPLKVETQTDPETGLTLLVLERLNTGTLDVEICFSVMWGSSVGNQGGTAATLMDKAGLRINRV